MSLLTGRQSEFVDFANSVCSEENFENVSQLVDNFENSSFQKSIRYAFQNLKTDFVNMMKILQSAERKRLNDKSFCPSLFRTYVKSTYCLFLEETLADSRTADEWFTEMRVGEHEVVVDIPNYGVVFVERQLRQWLPYFNYHVLTRNQSHVRYGFPIWPIVQEQWSEKIQKFLSVDSNATSEFSTETQCGAHNGNFHVGHLLDPILFICVVRVAERSGLLKTFEELALFAPILYEFENVDSSKQKVFLKTLTQTRAPQQSFEDDNPIRDIFISHKFVWKNFNSPAWFANTSMTEGRLLENILFENKAKDKLLGNTLTIGRHENINLFRTTVPLLKGQTFTSDVFMKFDDDHYKQHPQISIQLYHENIPANVKLDGNNFLVIQDIQYGDFIVCEKGKLKGITNYLIHFPFEEPPSEFKSMENQTLHELATISRQNIEVVFTNQQNRQQFFESLRNAYVFSSSNEQ